MTLFRTIPAHPPREAEWLAAAMLMGFATALLLPGHTFARPTFEAFAELAPEGTWGTALFCLALIRMLGLAINGNWRRSPGVRAVTSAGAGCLWLWLAWLFAHDGFESWNTGVFVYGVVGAFDLISAARSTFDLGRNDQRFSRVRRAAA